MYLSFVALMVSVILIWALAMTTIIVSMMTLTLTPMGDRTKRCMTICSVVLLLPVPLHPLRGIVLTVRLLLKAFALMSLSLIPMGDLLQAPAHLPVVIMTLTWMITAVAQVNHVSMVTTSLYRLGELQWLLCVHSNYSRRKRRREDRVM
jgi:hypothetical protein